MSGKRTLDNNRPSGEHNLIEWAKPYLNSKRRIFQVMDARIEGQYTLRQAMKVADLAVQCLSVEPRFRPKMDEVVRALEELQGSDDTIEGAGSSRDRNIRRSVHSSRSNGPRQHRSKQSETKLWKMNDIASYMFLILSCLYIMMNLIMCLMISVIVVQIISNIIKIFISSFSVSFFFNSNIILKIMWQF